MVRMTSARFALKSQTGTNGWSAEPVGDKMGAEETGETEDSRKIAEDKLPGQGLVEYALVLLLIAIVLIFMLTFIGAKLNTAFSSIGSGFGP